MAYAYTRTEIIETQTVVLELTQDEAQVLRDILGWGVDGPNTGRRALTVAIWASIVPVTTAPVGRPADLAGNIELLHKGDE